MTWPVGAMTLVRRHGDRLDVWTFADTTAFLRTPDGTVTTVGDAPDLRQFEMAKAAELLKASGCTPNNISQSPIFRDWLAGRRERKAQRRDGAARAEFFRSGKVKHQSVFCPDGTIILLTSDGFSALVDLYQKMSAAELMQMAQDKGLAVLVDMARRIETEEDPAEWFPPLQAERRCDGIVARA